MIRWSHRLVAAALLGAVPIASWADGPIEGKCAAMYAAMGAPEVKDAERDITIVCHTGHVLAHDNLYRTPVWVVERLDRSRFTGPAVRDTMTWRADDQVPVGSQADDADYKGQKSDKEKRSFDRGHMAPAASMKWSEEAMSKSFLLSNAAPQQGRHLNQHIWADLELLVREWTCDRRELYVITGPIYDTDDPDTLGPNKVAIPTAFFKVAYEHFQRRAIAFILPNQKVEKSGAHYSEVLHKYIAPVSEVEARAGIRLFGALSVRDRNRISRSKQPLWGVEDGCLVPGSR